MCFQFTTMISLSGHYVMLRAKSFKFSGNEVDFD